MAAALALAQRGAGQTGLNPNIGCIIVKQDRIIGRGWTQPGGRPHAEAMALTQAGTEAEGSTVYVTLEPCAHKSERGPSCADALISARPNRVVAAMVDPDPRTSGKGLERLEDAGISAEFGVLQANAEQVIRGFIMRQTRGRPFVTLKLATSLDGAIAMADGSSHWITGEAARAHTHIERMRCDAILVGAGTVRSDNPSLNVRLPGLEARSPRRVMLGHGNAPKGWEVIRGPEDISKLESNNLMVEGGAQTAASFLRAGLVDRLVLYRAPILIGGGKPCLTDIGLASLSSAHGNWRLQDSRMLGMDRMEVYQVHPQPG
jgi:diaminohydroxyphosphoribosylaminopyrimidine deaminase / 5-amino-6-(5-phosphoribosylamino)uracil reductase